MCFLQGAKLKYNHSITWCIIEAELSTGFWRKVIFIHKGGSGGGGLSSESGPQKLPCAPVQPWNQPDPIDSVYLARLQVKAIGNLGEIWRRLWFREGGGLDEKNKVMLSALQTGKAGACSEQPLTRLMVIFHHRHRLTVKISCLLFHFFFGFPLCGVPAAPHHISFSTRGFILAHHLPPGTKCSYLETETHQTVSLLFLFKVNWTHSTHKWSHHFKQSV